MSKLIGATAFVLAAAGFARWGDPIMASLLAVCAVVWGATVLVPLRDARSSKRGSVPRLE